MGRLILFGIVLLVTFVIWIAKQAAGKLGGSERLRQATFKDQTKKTMDVTARGINWLDDQWEEAKRTARGDTSTSPTNEPKAHAGQTETTVAATPEITESDAAKAISQLNAILKSRQMPTCGTGRAEDVALVSSYIGSQAVTRSGKSQSSLTEIEDNFALFITQIAAEYISKQVNADVSQTRALACTVFLSERPEHDAKASMIRASEHYHRSLHDPGQARVVRHIGNEVAQFFLTNDDEHLNILAERFAVLSLFLEGEDDVDTITERLSSLPCRLQSSDSVSEGSNGDAYDKVQWLKSRCASDVKDLKAINIAIRRGEENISNDPELRAAIVRLLSSPGSASQRIVRHFVNIDDGLLAEAELYRREEVKKYG